MSELPESFLLACGVPLLLTNYFILASIQLSQDLISNVSKSTVELETHDAGLAGGKVWYSGIKALIIF